MPITIERCVITIAVGKAYYYKLAENLLKSFLLWNSNSAINFLILTDDESFFKNYEQLPGVVIKNIVLAETDKSFTSKFSLYEPAFAEENLFIDCDCLVYKDLNKVFELFSGKNFSAIGNNITNGEFFCDVKTTLVRFNLPAMPKFVGSVYYFKKNNTAKKIFETARELKARYDELGFVRLRNKENEEPLFAVAMGMAGENLQSNDMGVKTDLMYYKYIKSNVLKGYAEAYEPLNALTGGEQIPNVATPVILHFNGPFSDSVVYKREVYRLNNQSTMLVNLKAYTLFNLPHLLKTVFKTLFRPLYHYLWGYRPIAQSNRSHTD